MSAGEFPEVIDAEQACGGDVVAVDGLEWLGVVHGVRYRERSGYVALTTRHRDGTWVSTLYRPCDEVTVHGFQVTCGAEHVRECG